MFVNLFQESPKKDNKMRIFAHSLPGETIALTVKPSYDIEMVKSIIMDKQGIPIDQQGLIFGSKELQMAMWCLAITSNLRVLYIGYLVYKFLLHCSTPTLI